MFLEESIAIQRVPPIEAMDTANPTSIPVNNSSARAPSFQPRQHTENGESEGSEDSRHLIDRSKTSLQYEVELVSWVRNNTTIPAPKPVSHSYDEASRQFVAVFEKPPGRSLSDCWAELSSTQKDSVVVALAGYMKELRSITTALVPNLYTRDRFLDPRDGVTRGPFGTTESFVEAVAHRIDRIGSLYEPGQTRKALRFLNALRASSVDCEMVFTHGNICPDNIYIDQAGQVVGIVDWSEAGYAPAFWEYVKTYMDDDDADFYLDGVPDRIMEPWPVPLAIMMHVHRIIW
ncbi:hypothetical protein S40293_02458 [Stachybotrys chartarum IBT 40293]|nr:hypothetical protein S40293_02458 [Stachybotrys chartarum IBT 40293]